MGMLDGLKGMLSNMAGGNLAQNGAAAVQQVAASRTAPQAGGPQSAEDAIFEAAFLVAAANGEISEPEIDQYIASIEQILGTTMTDEEAENLIATYNDRLGASDYDTRLAKVGEVLRGTESAGAAYVLSAGLAFIDEVDEDEDDVLSALGEALGLTDEQMQQYDAQVQQQMGIAAAE